MLVQKGVADRFTELVVEKTLAWTYGDPFDRATDMGTVIDAAAAELFEARVNDAVSDGRAAALRQPPQRRAVFADGARPRRSGHDARARGNLRPGVADHRFRYHRRRDPHQQRHGVRVVVGRSARTALDCITRFVNELQVGTVNVWEVPGYRIELTPFGGIKDSGLGYKEGVQEAMKSFTNLKTFSLPWV